VVFNSLHFVVFFAIVYAVYRLLQHRAQNLWLLAASYYFYAAWDWRFTGLLAASTLVSYWAGAALGRPGVRASRAASLRVLWAALGFLLAVLGFFKYAGFFIASAARALSTIGFDVGDPVLAIVLPLGISFYTFMAMAYVVDVYRGDMAPVSSLVDYALFVAYFPHLVAGPILRAPALMPQFAAPRTIRPADLSTGAWLIATGLFKKIVIADNLSPMVDAVFAPAFPAAGGDVLIACYAFALQIYGDFAGYSDMARGLSQLLGIELNVNFRFPYTVTNPREFWRHWHISLSTWLRDYLYVSLGGNRGGTVRTMVNLMITMLLGGLWHGAAWTFVLWGAFHGAWLAIHRVVARARPPRTPAWLRLLVTFHLVLVAWVLFRAPSLDVVGRIFEGLTAGRPMNGPMPVGALLIIAIGVLTHALAEHLDPEAWWMRAPRFAQGAVVGAVILIVGLFSAQSQRFIYFQF